jgi:hypothetical protein
VAAGIAMVLLLPTGAESLLRLATTTRMDAMQKFELLSEFRTMPAIPQSSSLL